MLKTSDVFGISSTVRATSYVDRGQLDNAVRTYLGRDTHIALRGESKCGKSWLRQKTMPDAIVVQCRLGKGVKELYVDALSQLDIKFDIERADSSSLNGKVTAKGEFGTKLLAKIGFGAEVGTNSSASVKSSPAGHNIDDLRYIAGIIKASDKRLVIEDFHYMSVDERRNFAYELKALWDYGVFVVLVGVWSTSNMLLALNPDLSGRIREVSVTWTNEELKSIVRVGGAQLNISFSDSMLSKLVEICYGNAGILQQLVLDTLDQNRLSTKQNSLSIIDNYDTLDSAAMYYADQLNPLYQEFAKRVSSGIRKRADSTGIYAHTMAVIVDSSDSELINGLPFDVLFEKANKAQPRIQKGNLRTVLAKIEELQVDEDGRGLVLSYNSANGEITAVDRQLLLYRKYSTINWPWDEIIKEAELS